ncbi:hypothetical protein LUX39_00650 [Actinomadura madurae]|nr:hypothetical protein [Actinomadura madurae]MCQ0012545.1 hypothetical protein [Actinomadura madurae]
MSRPSPAIIRWKSRPSWSGDSGSSLAGSAACAPATPGGRSGASRQGLDRPLPEHVPDGERQPGAAGAGDEERRADAVPAGPEEVVVRSHRVAAEDGGGQRGEDALRLRGRGPPAGRASRLGQGAPVDLAVGVERQLVQDDQLGRDQVVGQQRAQRVVQRAGVGVAGHVADEP